MKWSERAAQWGDNRKEAINISVSTFKTEPLFKSIVVNDSFRTCLGKYPKNELSNLITIPCAVLSEGRVNLILYHFMAYHGWVGLLINGPSPPCDSP